MKKSHIARSVPQAETPLRPLPLVDLLMDTRAELLELVTRSGLKVLDAMLEEDRTALCGPRYAHEPERPASRAGTVRSEVVLGGRKVAIQRPRVRTAAGEVPLPTFQTMVQRDPLDRRVVEQMLVGVATRQYARSLDVLPADVPSRGTSKSAVSRRFVAKTQAQLETWQARPLEDLPLVVLQLDGVHVGEHCLIVALGVTEDGTKHALGLLDGSTENSTVCQSLLANLQSRGLRTDRSLLVIVDGSKALHKAVRMMFGEAALVQRCQVHKLRNVLDHLPERQRPWVKAILQRAYRQDEVAPAKRLLQDLARRLEGEYPSAAESVREGLDETLTIIGLRLSPALRRSLSTTNAAESLISRTRHVKRNVKRWRGGQMVLRWVAAGVLEAVKGFRRLKGHKEMPTLVTALRKRDQQLGLVKAVENVA
ncbi:MAG TPA: IS256 family transposase [Gemmatimonadales bacterium]|nr:IS256 family transposase [Gemmatimonadales bacterium]